MSTRTTTLDERYGRTPDRRRRTRIAAIAAAAVVLLGVVVWSLWTGIGGATTALDVTTTGITVSSDEAADVQWLVSGRADTALVCSIEATDESGVVVGLAEVRVPATGQVNRTGETRVRTVRRAANGLIESCRDA
ncbi:DUF4307 domain-containing protein [Amnibacterium kyonggiense]|uniref:Uncharacterized protein DUF4307 n=1 Tax=Amnibacterium kyonggiense TaxID=595671 RepID=A0A4R7FF84_9MICO|nr:DUF4307 domain-containing protein [Amnibacterium kyonggiense]TDS76033.1 uncharacterized protein DUF4307 [Amnibacterium kyonggiense]